MAERNGSRDDDGLVEVNDDTISTMIVKMAEEGLLEIIGESVRITEKGRAELAKREARHG